MAFCDRLNKVYVVLVAMFMAGLIVTSALHTEENTLGTRL